MPPPPFGKNQLKKPEIILEKSCAKNHNLKKKVSREHSSPACVLLVLMCGIGWNTVVYNIFVSANMVSSGIVVQLIRTACRTFFCTNKLSFNTG